MTDVTDRPITEARAESRAPGTDWQSTACALCYVNCGVEVRTDGVNITRVRGDKAHPDTRGYICQKAHRLNFFQHSPDRLTTPLRRTADGGFEPVGWDDALDEITERLRAIVDEHGGRSYAYYGGGGQGNHLGGAYGVALMRALGSDNYYNALAQEKTGDFWVNGHMFGAQNCHSAEDVEHTDLLVVIGCNPWNAHGFRNARNHLNAIRKDDQRKMIVIDPIRTETAEMADLHLRLRPGTDVQLLSVILRRLDARGGFDDAFLAEHTHGIEAVRQTLAGIDVDAFLAATGVPSDDVDRAVDMMLATSAMCVRAELGIQQGTNSTLNSYLEKLLYLTTGNFGRPGTNQLHSWLQPLWGSSEGPASNVSGTRQIAGLFPPNRFTREVLTDDPGRLRALVVDSANPANTAADTARVEEALRALDLVVVIDVAFTETAALADYVLPAATQYEKPEFTMFNFEFPSNHFHLRHPVLDAPDGVRTEPEIYIELLTRLGAMPSTEMLDELGQLAASDMEAFQRRLFGLFGEDPLYAIVGAPILAETLGRTRLGDPLRAAAVIWAASLRCASMYERQVQRAIDSQATGGELGDELFQRIVTAKSGTAFTTHTYDEVWELVRHEDRMIRLDIDELLDWWAELDAGALTSDEFPLVLVAGQRRSFNANQNVRNPAFRKSDLDGALRLHPTDLEAAGLADGSWARVVASAGSLVARVEADERITPGVATIPHGYGQRVTHPDGQRVTNGPRINQLTDRDLADPIAFTPYHKNVPIRVEQPSSAEVAAAEHEAAQIREIVDAQLAGAGRSRV